MATPPDFSNGTSLDASSLNSVGLWKVTTLAFTNATAAAPADVVGCFTADYINYLMMFNTTAATANAELGVRLLANTTPAANNDYRWAGTGSTSGGVGSDGGSLTQNYFPLSFVTANGTIGVPLTIMQPQTAVRTTFVSDWFYDDGGTLISRRYHGQHNLANSYNGLRVYPLTGNMTGTLTIYGYRK